jgi:hypothetical protein
MACEDCRRLVDDLRQELAKTQIQTVSNAEGVKLDIAVMQLKQSTLEETFDKFCLWAVKELVNKDQFFPVRLIAYGLAGGVLMGFLGGFVKLMMK